MTASTTRATALSRDLLMPAIADAFRKLSPRVQFRNPVMFVVFVCSVLTTLLWLQALWLQAQRAVTEKRRPGFILGVGLWLWFTLLFANFAEAIAEGRGKAQAQSLRGARRDVIAQKLAAPNRRDAAAKAVSAADLRKGDIVFVKAGEFIPGDGEIVEGAATVDESAVTGESAPVIRESGGDRSSVTGGTRVLSDWIIVRIGSNPGESFLESHDRHGRGRLAAQDAKRNCADYTFGKGFTLIFLLACSTLLPYSPLCGCVFRPRRELHLHHRAGRLAGVPDSHHDRRPALGHRHRGYGSDDPGERDRDVRPRGGGGGRCRCAAAG